ncbi:uncharacterized protein LOC126381143 isoform X2 [Pectinophora gossypiella]|nr:uncharacterized protein LOC126381143 isoform X2 [Pectinophora gossypiella]
MMTSGGQTCFPQYCWDCGQRGSLTSRVQQQSWYTVRPSGYLDFKSPKGVVWRITTSTTSHHYTRRARSMRGRGDAHTQRATSSPRASPVPLQTTPSTPASLCLRSRAIILATKKAKTHDIFGLSHGRTVGNEGSDKRIVSYFVNKVANGSERRTTSLDGEYVVDLKIYHANDVNNTDSREVWRKALLRIKLQTPDDSDEWKLLQKLVTRIDKNFEDEPRFYSDKHVD